MRNKGAGVGPDLSLPRAGGTEEDGRGSASCFDGGSHVRGEPGLGEDSALTPQRTLTFSPHTLWVTSARAPNQTSG